MKKRCPDGRNRAERRAGGGGVGSSATELSAKVRKRDVARLVEDEATTADIAQEAERAAVAIAASCVAPPALRVVADTPAAAAAGGSTVPVFPQWSAPAATTTEGVGLGAVGAAADDEDSEDISVDAGGDY